MSRRVGFTGSRHGMTPEQRAKVKEILGSNQIEQFHHGDCIGADKEANDLASEFGIWTVGHPPNKSKFRAYCFVDELRDEADYLVRDEHIVEETDELIAVPNTHYEVMQGSGTWATKRMAVLAGKPFTIIYPDGSVEVQKCTSGVSPPLVQRKHVCK